MKPEFFFNSNLTIPDFPYMNKIGTIFIYLKSIKFTFCSMPFCAKQAWSPPDNAAPSDFPAPKSLVSDLSFEVPFVSVLAMFFFRILKKAGGNIFCKFHQFVEIVEIVFSNFSCRFLNPNSNKNYIFYFFQLWETSRNKLKRHSGTRNCSNFSLFESQCLSQSPEHFFLQQVRTILVTKYQISKNFLKPFSVFPLLHG